MATYYWVGGNGTWNNSSTTNWSNATGGSAGFGPPLSTDTVVFDSASGTGTCTTATGSACATATLNSSTLGLTLGANHTMSGTFTLTLGTLSLGSNTLTCNIFSSSNSNTRSVAFGTGGITLTGSGATILSMPTATGFSYTGTSNIVSNYAGSTGTRTFSFGGSGGATESNVLNFSITGGSDTFSFTGSLNNLTYSGFTGSGGLAQNLYGNLTLASGMTSAASATGITFAATSGTKTITTNGVAIDRPVSFNGVGGTWQLQDNCTVGSTRTVTLTNGTLDLNSKTLSTGLFSSSNSNTRSVAFGTGNITLTGSGGIIYSTNTGTGLSYTGTPIINCTYSGSTGTRTINAPFTDYSISNAVSVNVSAGSDTVTFGTSLVRPHINVDFTGFTGTCSEPPKFLYGSLTFVSGMTLSGTTGGAITFAATSGTKTITTAEKTIDNALTFDGIGGTWSFADALTQGSTRAFTITNGTVKLKAGATSTVGAFATSGSNQKYLQSTLAGSTSALSQASGTVTVTNLTIQDITVTGGATWNAFLTSGNVNGGNNTGWDWYYEPGEYMYTRRKTKRLLIQ